MQNIKLYSCHSYYSCSKFWALSLWQPPQTLPMEIWNLNLQLKKVDIWVNMGPCGSKNFKKLLFLQLWFFFYYDHDRFYYDHDRMIITIMILQLWFFQLWLCLLNVPFDRPQKVTYCQFEVLPFWSFNFLKRLKILLTWLIY